MRLEEGLQEERDDIGCKDPDAEPRQTEHMCVLKALNVLSHQSRWTVLIASCHFILAH